MLMTLTTWVLLFGLLFVAPSVNALENEDEAEFLEGNDPSEPVSTGPVSTGPVSTGPVSTGPIYSETGIYDDAGIYDYTSFEYPIYSGFPPSARQELLRQNWGERFREQIRAREEREESIRAREEQLDYTQLDTKLPMEGPLPIPPLRSKDAILDLLEIEKPGGAGIEIGVQRGIFSTEILRRWRSCRFFGMVDTWRDFRNEMNYDDGEKGIEYYDDGANTIPQEMHDWLMAQALLAVRKEQGEIKEELLQEGKLESSEGQQSPGGGRSGPPSEEVKSRVGIQRKITGAPTETLWVCRDTSVSCSRRLMLEARRTWSNYSAENDSVSRAKKADLNDKNNDNVSVKLKALLSEKILQRLEDFGLRTHPERTENMNARVGVLTSVEEGKHGSLRLLSDAEMAEIAVTENQELKQFEKRNGKDVPNGKEIPNQELQLFDFIYIDARHDYAGVLEDLRAWWPLLKRDGIIAGDDFDFAFSPFQPSLGEAESSADDDPGNSGRKELDIGNTEKTGIKKRFGTKKRKIQRSDGNWTTSLEKMQELVAGRNDTELIISARRSVKGAVEDFFSNRYGDLGYFRSTDSASAGSASASSAGSAGKLKYFPLPGRQISTTDHGRIDGRAVWMVRK